MTRRLLFVDDEPKVLEAIQRMLRPLRRDWDMSFAAGGSEALGLMDAGPFDVMVSDVRMPGMDGDELLAEVRRRHPLTVRIALTGQCHREAMVRLASLAHRVLIKPCDPDGLRTVIQRAWSLQDLLRSPGLAAVVGRLGSVPSRPSLYARVVEELEKPDGSLAAVGEMVARDVGMAVKLMQMANSALFGLRWPVTSPAQAVQVIGAETTKALLLAADVFTRYDPAALHPFSIDSLWEHSRRVGRLAGRIAHALGLGDRASTDASLAGLLHDVGRLTLASQLPGPYKEVLAAAGGAAVPDAERRLLGATHAEVGAYLLGLWGLPEPLVEAVAWHHTPSGCPGASASALTAVHAAEILLAGEEGSEPDEAYLERLGVRWRLIEWARLRDAAEAEG